MPTASILTIGCRLNQAEGALITDSLERAGYAVVSWGTAADLLIVNSCTVTAAAQKKTRKAVRSARKRQPQSCLAVVGCSADVDGQRWLSEGAADWVIPNARKGDIAAIVSVQPMREPTPRLATPNGAARATEPFTESGTGRYPARTRAHLKVQDGCNFFCSYCIVPSARGAPRSRILDDVVREARELIARGHRELVVTGVNIALYQHLGRDLIDLLQSLLALDGACRFRLSSVEPGPLLPRLARLMAGNPRLCRSLHVPLQYGEDEILGAMRRRYRVQEYVDGMQAVMAEVPELGWGTDVIVGFPGETAETFRICCEVLRSLPLAYLHVFRYSVRQGTAAAALPNRVSPPIVSARHERITALGRAQGIAFAEANVGRQEVVLGETRDAKTGNTEGWSGNCLRVRIPTSSARPALNEAIPVRIRAAVGPRTVLAEPAATALP